MVSHNQNPQKTPQTTNFRTRDPFIFSKAPPPYFSMYEPYLKEKADPKRPVWQQGYCMCKFNPIHIVRSHELAQHESFCPDRFVDKEINSKLDVYCELEEQN